MTVQAEELIIDPIGGFDPGHFPSLVMAEDRHFWFRVRNRVIAAAVRRLTANLTAGYRVLEVGCGTGNVLRVLERECRDAEVAGIELFGAGADYARRRVNCPVLVGDFRQHDFDAPFDIVGMFDVLEHIEDDVAALQRVAEILAPQGRMLITVPAHPRLWSDFDVAAHHHRRYTPASLGASLRQAGLTIQYLTPFMSLLYPLLRLRRGRGRAQEVDVRAVVDAEFRIIPGANFLAHAALLPEAFAVARGWRLPMGTSLLAVAGRSAPH